MSGGTSALSQNKTVEGRISCIKGDVLYRMGENVWKRGMWVILLYQEITIQIFTSMKKETKENIKSNMAAGAGAAVGSGIGVVAGSVIATDVNAAETSEMPIHTEEEEEVVVVSSTPERQTTQQSVASSTSGLEGEPEVEVVSYETVMNDDGSVMDVAVVSVDGQQAVVADVDMDGMADVVLSDVNGNGTLEDNEFVDVTGQGIMMTPFQEVAQEGSPTTLAHNQDYVNDADVTDYMA